MKKFSLLCLTAGFFLFSSVGTYSFAQDSLVNSLKHNKTDSDTDHFKFKEVINLEHEPVENQGHSGTCWSYSTNSFLESEMVSAGRVPVKLSKLYAVRNAYIEKGKQYVRMHGGLGLGQGGEAHDVIDMYRKYGAVPESAYTGKTYDSKLNNFSQMDKLEEAVLKTVVEFKQPLLSNWLKAYTGIVDAYMGVPPKEFKYDGKEYTPKSFAKEVVKINPDDYIEISSFKDYPMYQTFVMPVPDNWAFGSVYNVTMEDLTNIIDDALKNGYSVAWGTDVSEPYFSWKNGVAYVPKKDYEDMTEEEKKDMFDGPKAEKDITAEMRQEAFDNYKTTDDHGMQFIGIAKDVNGKAYYIVKNSWGTKNDYKGYLYVTKKFVQYKTTDIMINKKALSKEMREKLNIKL